MAVPSASAAVRRRGAPRLCQPNARPVAVAGRSLARGDARPLARAAAPGARGSGFGLRQGLPGSRAKLLAAKVSSEVQDELTLQPISKIDGTVKLPGSKSLSNRILLTAALAEGETKVENLLRSDDIQYMLEALKQVNVSIDDDGSSDTVTVRGCGGRFDSQGGELYLGNAGTAMRPLTAAVAAAGRGTFVMDGNPRMRERPIQDLVDGLVQLGVKAECTLGTGCPPVRIDAAGIPSGQVEISGSASSQFLTALLMASPLSQVSPTPTPTLSLPSASLAHSLTRKERILPTH